MLPANVKLMGHEELSGSFKLQGGRVYKKKDTSSVTLFPYEKEGLKGWIIVNVNKPVLLFPRECLDTSHSWLKFNSDNPSEGLSKHPAVWLQIFKVHERPAIDLHGCTCIRIQMDM